MKNPKGAGRKPRRPGAERKQFSLFLTPDEQQAISAAAQKSFRSVPEFIEKATIEATNEIP